MTCGPGKITRRSFLAGETVAVAAACSSQSRRPVVRAAARPDPGAPRRVIVVGAGLGGLTTAVRPRDARWDVVVLEARPRVGGRVHTVYGGDGGVPFDRGLRAEVGGESIDDTDTSLRNMLLRFRLETERRPGDTTSRAAPAATMAWSEEPFTRGGYAVYKPNQLGAFWHPLHAGTDRVHIAGEHVEALAGYMESAARSGIRVAAGIGAPPGHTS